MGSFKENRALSVIWDKLQSFLGYSGVSNPWLANTTIDEPLTLYVETTGNDLNPGTVDKPFKTIQGALATLQNTLINAAVTIQIGAGTFDGFVVDQSIRTGNAGVLTIQGHLHLGSNGNGD